MMPPDPHRDAGVIQQRVEIEETGKVWYLVLLDTGGTVWASAEEVMVE
jgi:hypothetical protein